MVRQPEENVFHNLTHLQLGSWKLSSSVHPRSHWQAYAKLLPRSLHTPLSPQGLSLQGSDSAAAPSSSCSCSWLEDSEMSNSESISKQNKLMWLLWGIYIVTESCIKIKNHTTLKQLACTENSSFVVSAFKMTDLQFLVFLHRVLDKNESISFTSKRRLVLKKVKNANFENTKGSPNVGFLFCETKIVIGCLYQKYSKPQFFLEQQRVPQQFLLAVWEISFGPQTVKAPFERISLKNWKKIQTSKAPPSNILSLTCGTELVHSQLISSFNRLWNTVKLFSCEN